MRGKIYAIMVPAEFRGGMKVSSAQTKNAESSLLFLWTLHSKLHW